TVRRGGRRLPGAAAGCSWGRNLDSVHQKWVDPITSESAAECRTSPWLAEGCGERPAPPTGPGDAVPRLPAAVPCGIGHDHDGDCPPVTGAVHRERVRAAVAWQLGRAAGTAADRSPGSVAACDDRVAECHRGVCEVRARARACSGLSGINQKQTIRNITAYARLAGVRYGSDERRWPCVPAQNMAVSVGLSVLRVPRPEDDGCRPPVEPVTAAAGNRGGSPENRRIPSHNSATGGDRKSTRLN